MISDRRKREYLYLQLPAHLQDSRKETQLVDLLTTDIAFIHQKLLHLFTNSLIADTHLSLVNDHPVVTTLREVLTRYGHIFDRCEEAIEMLNSLLVRMYAMPDFQQQVKAYSASQEKMLLLPILPLPDAANPYEIRTMNYGATRLGQIRALAFNHDGNLLFSATRESLLDIWDIASGQLLESLTGHEKPITCLEYNRERDHLVSGDEGGNWILWDLEHRRPLSKLWAGEGRVLDISLKPDGNELIVVLEGGEISSWSLSRLSKLVGVNMLPEVPVCAALVGNDYQLCLVGLESGKLAVLEYPDLKLRNAVLAHEGPVTSLEYSPELELVITGGYDHQIKLFSLPNLELLGTLSGHEGGVLDLAITPGGSMLASVGLDELVLLWDLKEQSLWAGLTGQSAPYEGGLPAVAFHPDGNQIASGSIHESIRLWQVPPEPVLEFSKPVEGYTCNFYPKSELFQIIGGENTFLDSGDWKVVVTIPDDLYQDSTSALSPDETQLWMGTRQGEVISLKFPGLEPGLRWSAHSDSIYHIVCGKEFVVTCSADGAVKAWRRETGELISELMGHESEVYNVALSPDEKTLVSVGLAEEMRVWSIQKGQMLHKLEEHPADIVRCRFSPSGNTLLTASHDGTAVLWDSKSWKVIRSYEGHMGWVSDAVFSPDERFVATASQDETLRIWEVESGEVISIVRLDGWMEGLAWHSSGQIISAVGQNGLFVFDVFANSSILPGA